VEYAARGSGRGEFCGPEIEPNDEALILRRMDARMDGDKSHSAGVLRRKLLVKHALDEMII
jgi:hypothetical protein